MELLAPAGNFEKMQAACAWGADAVYFGGSAFSLRAKAGNFDEDGLKQAVAWLHERGKKAYLTVNIFAHNEDLAGLKEWLPVAAASGVDAFIVSDPGVFNVIQKLNLNVPVHISTQANTTNVSAVNFWHDLGAERVILARELSRENIAQICRESECEAEVFVHGAICISMSGRCLISNYMTGRDANKGECTHPCRWSYQLEERTRPGMQFPVEEDSGYTFLYNSKDLCLIDRIKELTDMGVASAKIEGRMKSVMYVSIVTGVYRAAIDAAKKGEEYTVPKRWKELLSSVSNRKYTEGFYSGDAGAEAMNYDSGQYERTCDFLGVVTASRDGRVEVASRGKFTVGETLHFISPGLQEHAITITEIIEKGEKVENTRPNYTYTLPLGFDLPEWTLIRRENDEY